MAPETPERLTRWMLPMEGSHLPLDHPAQEDLAWAADEIARLRAENGRLREALGRVDAYLTTVASPRPDWLIKIVREALDEQSA